MTGASSQVMTNAEVLGPAQAKCQALGRIRHAELAPQNLGGREVQEVQRGPPQPHSPPRPPKSNFRITENLQREATRGAHVERTAQEEVEEEGEGGGGNGIQQAA
jgi:hypothetical protein